jgi:hypothetical protein
MTPLKSLFKPLALSFLLFSDITRPHSVLLFVSDLRFGHPLTCLVKYHWASGSFFDVSVRDFCALVVSRLLSSGAILKFYSYPVHIDPHGVSMPRSHFTKVHGVSLRNFPVYTSSHQYSEIVSFIFASQLSTPRCWNPRVTEWVAVSWHDDNMEVWSHRYILCYFHEHDLSDRLSTTAWILCRNLWCV